MRSTSSISIRTRINSLLLLAVLLLSMMPQTAGADYVSDALHIGIISVATEKVNPLTPVEREFMSVTDLMYEGLL